MTRKLIFIALLAAIIFALPTALMADDVEDAMFAHGLLYKYGFLDLAQEQAESVLAKSSCSRQAGIIARQVLIAAARYIYCHTTDPEERARMEQKLIEWGSFDPHKDINIIENYIVKFQKAENAAENYRKADKKDKDEYRKKAQKEYEKLLKELKTDVEKCRKKTKDIEKTMNEIAPEIRTSADARKKYQNLKAELGNLMYPRNSIEELTGEILFSYAMFLKDLDAAKTEELFKEVRQRMDIFINGFHDDDNGENDIKERWEFKELTYDATILLGKSEVFLKKYDDAIKHLKPMLDPPYPGNRENDLSREGGKEHVAEMEALLLRIKAEAHRWIAKTEQVYIDIITTHEKNLDKLTEDEADIFWKAKLLLAKCKSALGKFEQAAELYKDYIDSNPELWKRITPDGKVRFIYIPAHKDYVECLYKDFKKTGNKKSLWKATAYCGIILLRIDRDRNAALYWSITYRLLQCYFDLQEYKQVRSFCRRLAMDGTLEKLFNDYKKMHRKLLDLWKSSNDKLKVKEDKYLDNEEARWNKPGKNPGKTEELGRD